MPAQPDIVTGTVRAEGDAVAGADVLLFGPGERPPLLALATTDVDGSFELDPGAAEGPLTVLVRLKGDVIGVGAQAVGPDGRAQLDLPGPARALTIAVADGDDGRPPVLHVGLDPDEPAGVPAALRPFIDQTAPGAFASRFLTRELAGDTLVLRVLPGRWRISGEFIDLNRRNIVKPAFRNYAVAAARTEPDGAPLPGSEAAGFALDVDRDRRVALVLREVPDAEL